MRKLSKLFSYAPAKTYGALFLTFGLLSLIVGFAKNYFGHVGQVPLSSLIISAVFALIAIPLIFVEVPVSVMLERFKPTEIIFFEFFCIKRLYYTGKEAAVSPFVGALIGTLLAALGVFVPLWTVALGIVVIIFSAVTFLSPEFTFFSTLLCLPYLSLVPNFDVILAVTATLGAISFARKTLFGKRVISLEGYDFIILIMLGGILTSGIFMKGWESFLNALIICSAFFGYFLASNTVTNRRLADCAVNALALSSIPAVIVSYVKFAVNSAQGEPLRFLEEGISSTFGTSESAAAFFLVATVFSAVMARESHHLKRGLSSALLIINVVALVMTGETMAIFALLLGIVAYYSIKTGRKVLLVIPLLLVAPYALLLIPEEWMLSLPVEVYAAGTHSLLLGSLRAFLDHILLGIGMGPESFIAEMEGYGIFGFENSGNIFLELGLEAGIVTVSAFVLILLVRFIHRCSYQRYIKHSQVSKLSPFMSVSVVVLLIYGTFNYLFSDVTVMYLFWCVFGIGSGALRVAKGDHDDRIMYFEDEKSFDSAVINLDLR